MYHNSGQDDPRRYGARTSNPWSTRVLGVRLLLLGAFFSFIVYGRGRWVPTVGMASALRSVYRGQPRKGKPYDFFETFSKCLDPGSTPGSVGGYLYGGHSGGGDARRIPRHIFCPVLTPNPDQHKYSVHSRITQVPCTAPEDTVYKQPIVKSRRTRGPRAIWSWRGLRARHTRELVTCARWC